MAMPRTDQDYFHKLATANQAVRRFFLNYRLLMTAIEVPLFQELLKAIHAVGSNYQPTIASSFHETGATGSSSLSLYGTY